MNSNAGSIAYDGQELAHLLRDNIENKVQGFRFLCREMIKTNAEITPVYESSRHGSSRRGKKLTTQLIKRKIFSFSFPTDFDVSRFSGIDNMLSNLDNWDVQCRKRESGMCDTYYSHTTITGDRKLRSITEVVNRLLPEGYTKLETRKKKRKDDEDNDEENDEIETSENNMPQVRAVGLFPPTVYVPRKKRSYMRKVQRRKPVEMEKNIAPSSSTRVKEVFENKDNNVKVVNVSCPPLEIEDAKKGFCHSRIEDKENNPEIGNVVCLTQTKDKRNDFEAENGYGSQAIKDKVNNFEAGVNVCSQKSENTGNNYTKRNASCSQEMEAKETNMDGVSIEALLNPKEVSPVFSPSIAEVQPIVPVHQGVLEDMLKDPVVENDWTLSESFNNNENLPEFTGDLSEFDDLQDFSEFDDLIASFLK